MNKTRQVETLEQVVAKMLARIADDITEYADLRSEAYGEAHNTVRKEIASRLATRLFHRENTTLAIQKTENGVKVTHGSVYEKEFGQDQPLRLLAHYLAGVADGSIDKDIVVRVTGF